MIRLVVIIVIIISIACGSYALVLLSRLRKIYRVDYLNSFFYYEFLHLGFGLYGIIGGVAIREILLKFDLKSTQVESIVIAIPFFGVPFIIAAWYILLKMCSELIGKKMSQYGSILYFGLTTLAFLVYGLILKGSADQQLLSPEKTSQIIKIVFYSIDLVVKIYAMLILINGSLKIKSQSQSEYLTRLGLLMVALSIMSSLALHFSKLHPLIGLYFLLLFFGSDLVLILLTKSYLQLNSARYSDVTDRLEDLYQKYGISKREKEIIAEICEGLTNQQIADKLFISLQTVKDHTHNIFKKVNISNRVQLSQKFST